MKLKATLIAAATLAVGVISSQAQVYSQNIVGYVNVTITNSGTGYSLLVNPLNTGNNVLTNVIPAGSVPANTTKALIWNGSGYATYTMRSSGWSSGASSVVLNPGTGFFIQNTATTNISFTFIGSVETGTNLVAYNSGLTPIGSAVPVAGALQTGLGLPANNGDKVLQWNPATQGYITYTRRSAGWGGGLEPTIGTNTLYGVAEGFFFQPASGGNWTNVFNPQ